MTTTPIEIDPKAVEVAREAVAAHNSICRERLCPSLDCACGQFALAALSAVAPLLVAGERAWQSIETAPKNGTAILVAERGKFGWFIERGAELL